MTPGLRELVLRALLFIKPDHKTWKLEDPVQILADSPWEDGEELYDWYNRHADHVIDTIQLRKEHESPSYHEYVSFSLRGGECFRIDRRLYRGKSTFGALFSGKGMKAYDTISNISSLDDRSHGGSDCLIELKYAVEVDLRLLLKICQAIARHHLSRAYTFQIYNSTFHAQTIILYIAQEYAMEIATRRPNPVPPIGFGAGAIQHNTNAGVSLAPNFPACSPSQPHESYPSTPFVTHEDRCVTCWKLALLRRVVHWGGEIDSVENVSNLFWDGVARVAKHLIPHLDSAKDVSGVWFLSPRAHRMELCEALTYEAVRGTWDERLYLFEQNLVRPEGAQPQPECPRREYETLPAVHRSEAETRDNNSRDGYCPTNLKGAHYPEMATFLNTKVDDVEMEFKQRIREVCQANGAFHTALNNYYEIVKGRVRIRFGFRLDHPTTKTFIDTLALQEKQFTNLPEHVRIPPGFIAQSQEKYGSKTKERDLEGLQEYLILLLYAQGLRAELYKFVFGCDAATVVRDTTETRKDIWKAIIGED